MTPEEARSWLVDSLADFAEDLSMSKSLEPDEAMAMATKMLGEILPRQEATADHDFQWITHEGLRVGRVWYGPDPEDETGLYVWDLSVDDEHRNRGVGGSAMDAIAKVAETRALSAVALTVFDTNPDGRRLYERKGYVPVDEGRGQVKMKLDISRSPGATPRTARVIPDTCDRNDFVE